MTTASSIPVSEGSSLISSAQRAFGHVKKGADLLQASAQTIQQARQAGSNPFRSMAFGGGVAMIFSNTLSILDRFFSFNLSGALISMYGIIFGMLVILLEIPPNLSASQSGRIQLYRALVVHYAKFLEYVWGRGSLYVFVGTLQISNLNFCMFFPSILPT